MDQIYLPLMSALIGAIIGSGSSLLGMYLQVRSQAERERANRALQAAIEDLRIANEGAKASNVDAKVYPLSLYFWHHAELLKLVERDTLDADTLTDLFNRQAEIRKVIDRVSQGNIG